MWGRSCERCLVCCVAVIQQVVSLWPPPLPPPLPPPPPRSPPNSLFERFGRDPPQKLTELCQTVPLILAQCHYTPGYGTACWRRLHNWASAAKGILLFNIYIWAVNVRGIFVTVASTLLLLRAQNTIKISLDTNEQ